MADSYVCWKCGADIGHLPLPLGRMSKCDACKADLHVCVLCKFYDRTRSNQCREPIADAVIEKKRANFCGYFEMKQDAFQQTNTTSVSATEQDLASLFGTDIELSKSHDAKSAKSALDDLFGNDSGDKKKGDSPTDDDNSDAKN